MSVILYPLCRHTMDYADDGTLPVTLIGHSMGGYAVCCVLNRLNLSRHNIKNIVTYAAPDNLPEMALAFLNAQGSLISKVSILPNVTKMIISEPELNTHMGVVRKNGIAVNGINKEIVDRILEKL